MNVLHSIPIMHEEVEERIRARRQRGIDAHNATTNIVVPSCVVEDFVVVCHPSRLKHKISFQWGGPSHIVAVKSPTEWVVEALLTQKKETVHYARLKKYNALVKGMEFPNEDLDLANRASVWYEIVECIRDL